MELTICHHLFLHIVYLWILLSMTSLVLRLVLMILATDALYTPVLECTILVGQLNKIFGTIAQNIKYLHGIYWMVFKNIYFWCDTKSKLVTGLRGDIKTLLTTCYSHELAQLEKIIRRNHQADRDVFHVFWIPVWYFHRWHSLYCNISTK